MSTDPANMTGNGASQTSGGEAHFSSLNRLAGLAAVVGVGLFLAVGLINLSQASDEAAAQAAKQRLASAYLTGFTFWLSLPIGAVALLLIHHLVKSSWGLLLRQFFEAAVRTMPLLFLLWIGLAALASTDASPYWWTHPEKAHVPEGEVAPPTGDESKHEQALKISESLLRRAIEHEHKARQTGNLSFLSKNSFYGVGLTVFLIWGLLGYFLNKWGREAAAATDRDGVEAALGKAGALGGPGLIIYAITLTAAATQWVMSVEPSWSSTMFPVIFAVNQFLTCYALCLALFLLCQDRSPIKDVMRSKYRIDMGTLLLAFTLFWSYTSFSQFMLVWVGNLPEEIPFYLRRSEGGWWWVSAGLCVFHFAVPFLLLLFRDIKKHPCRLRSVAVYLLVVCAVDVTWWIEPAFSQPTVIPFWLMDIGAIVGIGGIWGLYFFRELGRYRLLETSALYRLPEGHDHEQH